MIDDRPPFHGDLMSNEQLFEAVPTESDIVNYLLLPNVELIAVGPVLSKGALRQSPEGEPILFGPMIEILYRARGEFFVGAARYLRNDIRQTRLTMARPPQPADPLRVLAALGL